MRNKTHLHFIRKGLSFTFGITTRKRHLYVLQIDLDALRDLKTVWWYPKCDKNCAGGLYTMFGWLFVRFGKLNSKHETH